jgi:hypothetical protein
VCVLKICCNIADLNFLLPLNEVNIKYRFSDFKKKFFIDFLDELGLFIEKKSGFYEKKISVALLSAVAVTVCRDFMAVHRKILSARYLKVAFKLETFLFGSEKKLV